jgi:hypothetical protein
LKLKGAGTTVFKRKKKEEKSEKEVSFSSQGGAVFPTPRRSRTYSVRSAMAAKTLFPNNMERLLGSHRGEREVRKGVSVKLLIYNVNISLTVSHPFSLKEIKKERCRKERVKKE